MGDNIYGIEKLVVSFDGKAQFTTHKRDNAVWHCFWTTISKIEIELMCKPSTNPVKKERYTLTINKQGIAQLIHNKQQITEFTRIDKNPSLDK